MSHLLSFFGDAGMVAEAACPVESGLAALAEDAGDGTVAIGSLYLPDMAGTDLVMAMSAASSTSSGSKRASQRLTKRPPA